MKGVSVAAVIKRVSVCVDVRRRHEDKWIKEWISKIKKNKDNI